MEIFRNLTFVLICFPFLLGWEIRANRLDNVFSPALFPRNHETSSKWKGTSYLSSGVYNKLSQNLEVNTLKKNSTGKSEGISDGEMSPKHFVEEKEQLETFLPTASRKVWRGNSSTSKMRRALLPLTPRQQHSKPNQAFRTSRGLETYEFQIELQVYLDALVWDDIQTAVVTGKFESVEEYLTIFFNGVNHIYEKSHPNDIFSPEVKVRICNYTKLPSNVDRGIFTGVDDDDSVHVVEHVLKYFRLYAKKYTETFDKYDHTILLTGRDLHLKSPETNLYDPGVLGVAFLNGICTKSYTSRFEAFSVVEDPGAMFLGVYPAVHELAHNLGVKHDSKSDVKCNTNLGFIMSPSTSGTSQIYHFSTCSLDSMRVLGNSESSRCLHENRLPSVSDSEESRLPGELYSMREICNHLAERKYPNEVDVTAEVNPFKSPSDLCKQISCKVTVAGRKFTVDLPLPPGEKTSCGLRGKCIDGECVDYA